MWETTEERAKGVSRQHLNLCVQCTNSCIHLCEIDGKCDLVVEVCGDIEKPDFCFHPFISLGQLCRPWFSKLGIVNSLQGSAWTLSHVADIKLHLPFTEMASNLCSKHCSCCWDEEGWALSPSINAWSHVFTCKVKVLGSKHTGLHDSASPHSHWTHGQSTLVCYQKKAKTNLHQGATQPWAHTSALPQQSSCFWQAPSLGQQLLGQPHWRDSTSSQGSWAHTINISTCVQLLHRKTSAFVILS